MKYVFLVLIAFAVVAVYCLEQDITTRDDDDDDDNGPMTPPCNPPKVEICLFPSGNKFKGQAICLPAATAQKLVDRGKAVFGPCPDCFCSLDEIEDLTITDPMDCDVIHFQNGTWNNTNIRDLVTLTLEELEDTDMIEMAVRFDHLAFNVTGSGFWKPHNAMRLDGGDSGFLPNNNSLEVVGRTSLGNPDSNTVTSTRGFAFGDSQTVEGDNSAALAGAGNLIFGPNSAAIGEGNRIDDTVENSFVMGTDCTVADPSRSAFAGGTDSEVEGDSAFAFGENAFALATAAAALCSGEASGRTSFAAAAGKAVGELSTAVGDRTIASGRGATTMGECSTAAARAGFSSGDSTKRSSNDGSAAVGRCNADVATNLFEVGNGSPKAGSICGCDSTSNALSVSNSGDLFIGGDLDVTGDCGKCGPGGLRTTVIVTSPLPATVLPAFGSSFTFAGATCPVGRRVSTGSCRIIFDSAFSSALIRSGVNDAGSGITCEARNLGGAPTSVRIRTVAICEVGPLP